MSNTSYNSPEFWHWVKSHITDVPTKLRLAGRTETDFDLSAAITQIECRQRFGKKLNETLSVFPEFYFPSTLSGEQSTGDLLAEFHRTLVGKDDILVDFTAGLGIDVMHLAKSVKSATAVEKNDALCDALKYNASGLGIENITVLEGDARELVDYLSGTVAYIDPARRAGDGSRVFGLRDCEPDILEMMPSFKKNFKRLIVKASPMLDITHTLEDIPCATDIYIIGTNTECKELVVSCDLQQNITTDAVIHAVTLFRDGSKNEFVFTRQEEADTLSAKVNRMPTTKDVLYIPYPATMKAAPVKLLAERFGVEKFHSNTHLYFGPENDMAKGFPGEILKIVDVIPWQSKNLKRLKSTYPNIMVSVRNFGMSAEALRAKLGVKESGDCHLRLFGIGLGNDHKDRLLIVAK